MKSPQGAGDLGVTLDSMVLMTMIQGEAASLVGCTFH
uniref:Uncharacterized protein n=1 Tax=Arundo donax TaxID=35708 RepID=A0A0A8ZDM5_ARUDO